MLTSDAQTTLLALAKQGLQDFLTQGKPTFPPLASLSTELTQPSSIFVTLRRGPALRGCLGNLESNQPLAYNVIETTIRTATEDPRFERLAIDELASLSIEISILSPLRRANSAEEIIPVRHGVVVKRGPRRGLFLPQVWKETGWDKDKFLNELCRSKCGLPETAWKDPQTELWIFTTQSFMSPISDIRPWTSRGSQTNPA